MKTLATILLASSLRPIRTAALASALAVAVAPATMAQTVVYTSVLSGVNEVPLNASTGTGSARFTINTSTLAWTLTGSFSGLSGNATAAHIHTGAAGANGGVLVGLNATTGATSGTLSGSGTFTSDQYTTLQANGLYVNLHSMAFPGGELRDQLRAASVTVDGSCDEPAYVTLATVDNSTVNNGFGDGNDLAALKYYADGTNIYVCAAGEAALPDLGSPTNGFAFFLNFSNYDGIDGGTAIPAGGPGFFGKIAGTTLPSGLDTDWIFFFTRANTNKIYTNVARLGTSSFIVNPNGDYLGEATENAGAISFNGNVVSENGSGTGQLAYQTGYDASTAPNKGYEIAIPISAFTGVSPRAFRAMEESAAMGIAANDQLSLFAIISNFDGYFSNEMLPDANLNGTGGAAPNFGNAPNLSAASGTTSQPLPVELVSFTSSVNGRSARLNWTTASETNNAGFYVEQQNGNAWIAVSNLINGHGTTTERNAYAFDVTGLTAGSHTFRLRQVDTDGAVHYSATTTVEIAAQDGLALTALGARGLRVESEAAATVSVFDLMGRRVLQREVGAGTSVVTLEGVGAGVYVVRAESAGKVATTRLVVR